MHNKQFICTLLSDVILSMHSSATGIKETLDFIPGNNFLGIVAKQLYNKLKQEEQLALFHSAEVYFGDAHPYIHGQRAIRVPVAYYHPKYDENTLYIHHLVDHTQLHREQQQLQLKQCRKGFYIIEDNILKKVNIITSISVKSAYDSENRRSKDEQMYTYQSMQQGAQFAFEVRANNAEVLAQIENALCGIHSIGRSRTAQYGRVEIAVGNFQEPESQSITSTEVVVYADSRLIFIDQYGLPTMQPTAEDLGLNGKILWDKSQIRTFQYAPWNGKRQEWDMDRCGIEKGSVFVVECTDVVENLPSLVGAYTNEGFGKVIINPTFLQTRPDTNGQSLYQLGKLNSNEQYAIRYHHIGECDRALVQMLETKQAKIALEQKVYQAAKDFVEKHQNIYQQAKFKSQWGQIRSIAMSSTCSDIKDTVLEYLEKGVKKTDWAGKPLTILKKAMEDMQKLSPEALQLFLVNVASRITKLLNQ